MRAFFNLVPKATANRWPKEQIEKNHGRDQTHYNFSHFKRILSMSYFFSLVPKPIAN
jgi:hypothetical protein